MGGNGERRDFTLFNHNNVTAALASDLPAKVFKGSDGFAPAYSQDGGIGDTPDSGIATKMRKTHINTRPFAFLALLCGYLIVFYPAESSVILAGQASDEHFDLARLNR